MKAFTVEVEWKSESSEIPLVKTFRRPCREEFIIALRTWQVGYANEPKDISMLLVTTQDIPQNFIDEVIRGTSLTCERITKEGDAFSIQSGYLLKDDDTLILPAMYWLIMIWRLSYDYRAENVLDLIQKSSAYSDWVWSWDKENSERAWSLYMQGKTPTTQQLLASRDGPIEYLKRNQWNIE